MELGWALGAGREKAGMNFPEGQKAMKRTCTKRGTIIDEACDVFIVALDMPYRPPMWYLVETRHVSLYKSHAFSLRERECLTRIEHEMVVA